MFNQIDEEGVAIACKWPIYSASSIFMDSLVECVDPLRRAAVQMSIVVGKNSTDEADITGADLVDIYATHWSYSDCNQEMNAMKTLELVNNTSVAKSAFILGDFNAYDERVSSIKLMETVPIYLSGDYTNVKYMKDSWRSLYPDAETYPGYTYSSLEEKGGLHNRCDMIFYSGRVIPLSAEIICKNPGSELAPSDHCAYMFTSTILSTDSGWEHLDVIKRRVLAHKAHLIILIVEICIGTLIIKRLRRKNDHQ